MKAQGTGLYLDSCALNLNNNYGKSTTTTAAANQR